MSMEIKPVLSKHEYIKKIMDDTNDGREQTRWNLSDADDAATLYMELRELEWRYHHLAMLKYRNHKHKEFHSLFGEYWGIRLAIDIIFPWSGGKDVFSRRLKELDREAEAEAAEIIARYSK